VSDPVEPAVRVHRRGSAVTIELHRPERLNAFNTRQTTELRAALEDAAADETVRAVCLTGAGRAFSSGADLLDMEGREGELVDGRPDLRLALRERFNPITLLLREMPKPVVAAVNGPCVGVALGYALACDHIVAAESAYFLLAFVNIGLVPDGGASVLVPARVGVTRATEFAMSGRRLPAGEALEWGLVNEVVADDALAARAGELLDRFAAGPTRALAGIKRQVNAQAFGDLAAGLALEADIQQEMAHTEDFVAGVTAFASKGTAEFQGR
jgi:2-(1,2-epoxy-1,2-dihydrophenyl)acetyl-CoA isomerase